MRSALLKFALLLDICLFTAFPLHATPKICAKNIALLNSRTSQEYIAKKAGLEHDTKIEEYGIVRKPKGKQFTYQFTNGVSVTNPQTLEWLQNLKVPKIYPNVLISTNPKSHLLYIAKDAKGKEQYRYHPDWIRARKDQKFARTAEFGMALPKLRKIVAKDISSKEILSKSQVLAAMVRLLDKTNIRVGSKEYAKENQTFGLSTLEKRHVKVRGSKITLNFVGKASKEHTIPIEDAELAQVITRLLKQPGKTLFQYSDEHQNLHALSSSDVNGYLATNLGSLFTAKDFRTWGGTVEALHTLKETSDRKQAIDAAAEKLGNTPAMAEKAYIHPRILEAEGAELKTAFEKRRAGLSPAEAAVLNLLGD